MFMFMLRIGPNLELLKALQDRSLSNSSVWDYRYQYQKKHKILGIITAIWLSVTSFFMIIALLVPGPYTVIPFIVLLGPGLMIMYPIVTAWMSAKTVLTTINETYPEL